MLVWDHRQRVSAREALTDEWLMHRYEYKCTKDVKKDVDEVKVVDVDADLQDGGYNNIFRGRKIKKDVVYKRNNYAPSPK